MKTFVNAQFCNCFNFCKSSQSVSYNRSQKKNSFKVAEGAKFNRLRITKVIISSVEIPCNLFTDSDRS